MSHVPRLVRESTDYANHPKEVRPLADFRNVDAWILLGEPGAGKSESFKMEAAETERGRHLTIAEFIYSDDIEAWSGETLFLDGLDEVRGGSGGDSLLIRVRQRLARIGSPRFRIACRAADWSGSSDLDEIKRASPDRTLAVLLLEPLGKEDICVILRDNHRIADAETFVAEAERRGMADLLDNPENLRLLTKAVEEGHWPKTRRETFELACRKLAEESNKKHRDSKRERPESIEGLLDAGGQLFAALLLADKSGIALDPDQANDRFPLLEEFTSTEPGLAFEVVRRRLFRPDEVERFVPGHRGIAEFLAARWLAKRVDHQGLPLGRLLNLLLGVDGRTVAGLRGLYAWLALLCLTARTRLNEADPVTVVTYGDVKPMPVADKRRILVGLKREAERYTGFRWEMFAPHSLGSLSDPALADDFIVVLEDSARDGGSQAYAACILDILAEGEVIPRLAENVKRIIADTNRWPAVRIAALEAWLKLEEQPEPKLALLDAVSRGEVDDSDDQLAGQLLRHLYPEHLPPSELMRHFHTPKAPNLLGAYTWFWGYELPKLAPSDHLPQLLDWLAESGSLDFGDYDNYHLKEMAVALLINGIERHGGDVDDRRLFRWLGIGNKKYGMFRLEEEHRKWIAGWIEARPDRHKALWEVCFEECCGHEYPTICIGEFRNRLLGTQPPRDLGLWHMQRASTALSEEIARAHVAEALGALVDRRGDEGLSLGLIEGWPGGNPEREEWLANQLFCEISEWVTKEAERKRNYRRRLAGERHGRTTKVAQQLPAIRAGQANLALMNQLAGVWMGYFSNIRGDTPAERFECYAENGRELLEAAETGFISCLERSDRPSVPEIIWLVFEKKHHYIRLPCLVGMALLWGQSRNSIDALPDETLRRVIAFRLTFGMDQTPEWFTYLVVERAGLVAEVLVEYATAMFKLKEQDIDSIYPLEKDLAYRAVAVRAAPTLLEIFPLRAETERLRYLQNLLKAALRYRMPELSELIARKIALKGMTVPQKAYWFAAGILSEPTRYEDLLWRYIGGSLQKADYLSEFLSEGFGNLDEDFALSEESIGRLIELLTPHAEFERPQHGHAYRPTEALQRGDRIRSFLNRLAAMGTGKAEEEVERLIARPGLDSLKFALESARHQCRLNRRENEFRFPPLSDVARILANREPANVPDLAALACDHLDDIAREIRTENDDGFREFWNPGKSPPSKLVENYCRDRILYRLRVRLTPFGVECQPEGDYANDKRADIRLSFRNELELPIELKRDDNPTLWNALKSQLIDQYSIAPKAANHGIYLVLWFGKGGTPRAHDGGGQPKATDELRKRLENQLSPEDGRRIFVRVLDVSWPG